MKILLHAPSQFHAHLSPKPGDKGYHVCCTDDETEAEAGSHWPWATHLVSTRVADGVQISRLDSQILFSVPLT